MTLLPRKPFLTSALLVAVAGGCSGGTGATAVPGDADAGAPDSGHADSDSGTSCPNGCLIGGVCYPDGTSNANVCERCDPLRSSTAWSDDDGASCDDGLYCTVDDKCSGSTCMGVPRDCSDGVACNGVETCDEAKSMCMPAASTCAGGTLCDYQQDKCVTTCTGCVILGVCYGDGQTKPLSGCLVCLATVRPWGWSTAEDGALCEDGLYCTTNDQCVSGACIGGPSPQCSDGIACNGQETCDESSHGCRPGTTTCTGNTVCSPDDECTCFGCLIEGECLAQGDACDDGEYCTVDDVCAWQTCRGTPRDCSDGLACNGVETCDEEAGACVTGATTCPSNTVCDYVSDACVTACAAQGDPVCDAHGDVVWFDSCGHELLLEHCPSPEAHGICQAATCGCAPGFIGDDCTCMYYVDGPNGSDANTGTSWEQALATVQAGINAADADNCEVWVKAGRYVPTVELDPSDEQTKTIQLRSGVALYGGFAGGEVLRSQRDVQANKTILSGDIDSDDVASNNAYHVVTGANGATIDGFVITASLWEAMFNLNVSPVVASCTFSRNFGSGMLNTGGSPTVTDCVFSDNTAISYGGGICNEGASPVIANSLFVGNSAQRGGAISNNGSSAPTITNCIFQGNEGSGGGAVYNLMSSPTITDCVFSHNSAHSGGAMYNDGGQAVVKDCRFSGNEAPDGGAMFNFTASPTVDRCIFEGNSASGGGGISNTLYADPLVTNCIFEGNSATLFGGGVASRAWGSARMTNCTFAGNSAGDGSTIWNDHESSSTVSNCILWDGEVENDSTSSTTVTYSIVKEGYPGTGNSAADPLFVDEANGDLRLQSGSPAIDSGSDGAVPPGVATDIDGHPRVVDGDSDGTATVDMGAYEAQ